MKKLNAIQRGELIEQFVELVVNNMDSDHIAQIVTDMLEHEYDKCSDIELKECIDNYNSTLFDELVNDVTNIKCESNNKNNVTYNEVDYVEQCITEGNDYRDCVDTLSGVK